MIPTRKTLLFQFLPRRAACTDPLATCYAVAVSPDDKYYGRYPPGRHIFLRRRRAHQRHSQLRHARQPMPPRLPAPTARGVAFDAADNIYLSFNGGADRLRVYSPRPDHDRHHRQRHHHDQRNVFSSPSATTLIFPIIIGAAAPANLCYAGLPVSFAVTSPLGADEAIELINGDSTGSRTFQTTPNSPARSRRHACHSPARKPPTPVPTPSWSPIPMAPSASAVATLTVTVPSNQVPIVWTQMANSPGPNNVRHDDISFTDPTNGWASQDNLIYRTTNGGATWTTVLNCRLRARIFVPSVLPRRSSASPAISASAPMTAGSLIPTSSIARSTAARRGPTWTVSPKRACRAFARLTCSIRSTSTAAGACAARTPTLSSAPTAASIGASSISPRST